MIKINKFFRNNLYQIILAIIVLFTILILNFYSINKNYQKEKLFDSLENIYLKKTSNYIIKNLNPKFSYKNIVVNKGDSFEKVLSRINISKYEKGVIIKNLSKFKFIKKLYQGQKISFKLDNATPIKVVEINIQITKTKNAIFSRLETLNKFDYFEEIKNLEKVIVYKEAEITKSLYASAIDVKIKPNIIIEFARIYGFQIDFQRDIWKNDSFQIFMKLF